MSTTIGSRRHATAPRSTGSKRVHVSYEERTLGALLFIYRWRAVRKCRELDLLPVLIPPRDLRAFAYVLGRMGQCDPTSLLRQAL